jgi:hypothetical protein
MKNIIINHNPNLIIKVECVEKEKSSPKKFLQKINLKEKVQNINENN